MCVLVFVIPAIDVLYYTLCMQEGSHDQEEESCSHQMLCRVGATQNASTHHTAVISVELVRRRKLKNTDELVDTKYLKIYTTSYFCFHSYQTELTHNAHMMQIQDETIRSLASEVVHHMILCDLSSSMFN